MTKEANLYHHAVEWYDIDLNLYHISVEWYDIDLTIILGSIFSLNSRSSESEYLASEVNASTGPFSVCCLIALYNMNMEEPA